VKDRDIQNRLSGRKSCHSRAKSCGNNEQNLSNPLLPLA